MVKHNNILPNVHCRKEWQLRVKTWFDQPGRKSRRRQNRAVKAAKIAPNPINTLRPGVHGQTFKYHTKVRAGRGFTYAELKAAGIDRKTARTVGIAVDHRRRNRSQESLDLNTDRLKAYKSKLIVFPRRAGQPKKGDCTDAAAMKSAVQNKTRDIIPFPAPSAEVETAVITPEMQAFKAFFTLRTERANVKYFGARQKRAADKAKAEDEKKK